MRYIDKVRIRDVHTIKELESLRNYVITQQIAEPPLHPNFDSINKAELASLMNRDQGNLCCYCMGSLSEGYHIEHCNPQSAFKNEEVLYENLFLSCGDRKSTKTHCGHAKADTVIGKLMSFSNPKTGRKCEAFFKFNQLGEILPVNGPASYSKAKEMFFDPSVNHEYRMSMTLIDVLNLNCEELTQRRKAIVDTIMVLDYDAAKFKEGIARYQTKEDDQYLPFPEVAIFFFKLRLEKGK